MKKNIPAWGKTIIYGAIAALAVRLLLANVPSSGKYL